MTKLAEFLGKMILERQGYLPTVNDSWLESKANEIYKMLNTTMTDNYEVVGWPEIQDYMEFEGFKANSTLIEPNDAMGIGSSTYLINRKWIESL